MAAADQMNFYVKKPALKRLHRQRRSAGLAARVFLITSFTWNFLLLMLSDTGETSHAVSGCFGDAKTVSMTGFYCAGLVYVTQYSKLLPANMSSIRSCVLFGTIICDTKYFP